MRRPRNHPHGPHAIDPDASMHYVSICRRNNAAGIQMTTGSFLRSCWRPFPGSLLPKLALVLALFLAAPWLTAPTSAFAADRSNRQTDLTARPSNSRPASYLDQLLNEINARRAQAGTQPVVYVGQDENQAVGQYLADLTPWMLYMHSCFHGQNNPVSPSWDYVKGVGFDGEARGEVLACPGDDGFWTAPKIADGWWSSPSHWQSLYGDPRVNAIACGTFGPQSGGGGGQTIPFVPYPALASPPPLGVAENTPGPPKPP